MRSLNTLSRLSFLGLAVLGSALAASAQAPLPGAGQSPIPGANQAPQTGPVNPLTGNPITVNPITGNPVSGSQNSPSAVAAGQLQQLLQQQLHPGVPGTTPLPGTLINPFLPAAPTAMDRAFQIIRGGPVVPRSGVGLNSLGILPPTAATMRNTPHVYHGNLTWLQLPTGGLGSPAGSVPAIMYVLGAVSNLPPGVDLGGLIMSAAGSTPQASGTLPAIPSAYPVGQRSVAYVGGLGIYSWTSAASNRMAPSAAAYAAMSAGLPGIASPYGPGRRPTALPTVPRPSLWAPGGSQVDLSTLGPRNVSEHSLANPFHQ